MSRLSLAPIEGNVFQKAMGLRPEIMKAWFDLDEEIRFKGELDPQLKEEVRRNLALGIGCEFCSSLGAPSPDAYDRKVSLAVAFAQLVFDNIHDLRAIDDAQFAVLREEFSEAAIVELVCWSLFLVAAQGFGAIMKIRPANPDELGDYNDWRAAGEAQAASGEARAA